MDIAAMEVSRDPEEVLVTYALGSCIAVLVYDTVLHAAGMIHFMLPVSTSMEERARSRPAMFADTGIPMLFHGMYALGSQKRDLIVKVTGGASVLDGSNLFEIGKRNHTMVRKMFWKAGVRIAAEDVGGSWSRTARLEVATGRVLIHTTQGDLEL